MKLVYLSLLMGISLGCQDTQPSTDMPVKSNGNSLAATSNAAVSSIESDSTEGVVGPDEAYFAGVFLNSLFKASKSNPFPVLADVGATLRNDSQIEAFDFAANLQPKRVELMAKILLALGNKDADDKLNFEEFSAVQLNSDLSGGSVSTIGHEFNKDLFDAAAGDDTLLSDVEIQELLVKIAGATDLSKMSKQEIRKALVSGWEKVIAAYDANKDGRADLDEQHKLRKDRAALLGKFLED